MMIDKDPRLSKQPNWVQNGVANLERHRADWEAKYRKMVRVYDGEGSNVYISRYGQEPVWLEPDSTVTFIVPGPDGPEEFDVSERHNRLEVYHTHALHHTQMAMFPSSSNVFLVGTVRR